MNTILRCSPAEESVYQFMDKKRAESKPYGVYMLASANKFLRIYYATVKHYLVITSFPERKFMMLKSIK